VIAVHEQREILGKARIVGIVEIGDAGIRLAEFTGEAIEGVKKSG
jgi:hypothetical protein